MRAEFADWEVRRRAAETADRIEAPRIVERVAMPNPVSQPPADLKEETDTRGREAEPATEIHGPSFLGLSGEESSSSSYLLDDEPNGGSKTARKVAVLILLLAIAVVIWKWEPIKTYVWTEASKHSQTSQPAVATPPAIDTAANGAPAAMPQNDQPDLATSAAAKPASGASEAAPKASLDSAAIDSETPAASSAAKSNPEDKAAAMATPSDEKAASSGTPPANSAGDAAAGTDKAADSKAAKPEAEDSSPSDSDAKDEASARAPAREPDKSAAATAKQERGADLLSRGEAYLYGRGVPQSCRQALVYFKAAADRDNPGAMSHVAAMYATGECGVHINRVQAYRWFSKAFGLQPSNHYLEQNLTMLWRQMSAEERQAATRSGGQRGE